MRYKNKAHYFLVDSMATIEIKMGLLDMRATRVPKQENMQSQDRQIDSPSASKSIGRERKR